MTNKLTINPKKRFKPSSLFTFLLLLFVRSLEFGLDWTNLEDNWTVGPGDGFQVETSITTIYLLFIEIKTSFNQKKKIEINKKKKKTKRKMPKVCLVKIVRKETLEKRNRIRGGATAVGVRPCLLACVGCKNC